MIIGKWLRQKLCQSGVIACGFLSILLVEAALADYKPPVEQEPPSDYTKSGTAGSRGGCQGSEAIPLTLLTPQTHIGQTASTHPTFAWFVPTSENVSMEFRLFEYDLNNKPTKLIVALSIPLSSAKIRKISLSDKYSLTVRKKYLWQIAIDCPDSQLDLIARADIKVVSSSLTEPALSSSKLAETYAQLSLWYDALGQALEVAKQGKLGEDAAILLEELANYEAGKLVNSTAEAPNPVDRLRQIAVSER